MNSKKAKALRKLYNARPMLNGRMTFKEYKTYYIKDVAKGSKAIVKLNSRGS